MIFFYASFQEYMHIHVDGLIVPSSLASNFRLEKPIQLYSGSNSHRVLPKPRALAQFNHCSIYNNEVLSAIFLISVLVRDGWINFI